jgi:formylglycine-generating enzyme required for sulfatase activity
MPESVLDEKSGIEFVAIPAGEFTMGSTDFEDSQPVRKVRVSAFQIGRTEVTREQYALFMKATGAAEPYHWKSDLFVRPGSPVIGVTHEDALAYCRWAGGRLPTEAEWEYAARGTDGRRYPWGNEEPDKSRAFYHLDVGFGGTMPVAQKAEGASPFGLLDMAGNAFEWCADWYSAGYYASAPAVDPKGPAAGKLRVMRGGSWISLPDMCRCAARASFPPGAASTLVGFRVAR